jgi:hypothetical protein
MTELSDFDKSKSLETAHKEGQKGYANAFLEQKIKDGNGIFVWKENPLKSGYLYGLYATPGVFHTNENEAGVDVALWIGDVQKSKAGKITRSPTFKFNKKTGKRMVWYQQLIVPWELAEDVGKAMSEIARKEWGNQKKGELVVELKTIMVDSEQAKIDAAMRKLGLLGGV